MNVAKNIEYYNQDNSIGMKTIEDESIDCILTDPPYLYLKNQKLDREFDEELFFNECKRVLKDKGFIVMFGRGTSFYRWNTILAELGFTFKEEVIWDKRQTTSPVLPLSRIHEAVSIHSKGNGKIKKVKVNYIKSRNGDLATIQHDLKRICTAFGNNKHFADLKNYLNTMERLDYKTTKRASKHGATFGSDILGSRTVNAMQNVIEGLNEKSIIYENRNHYESIHPTQKPVKLLERLLKLVTKKGDVVLDPFAGSGSTAVACYNTHRKFKGFEIDEEFYNDAVERIKTDCSQGVLNYE